MKKKKKGFTLIELLVVMVVLAIIALITVPNALNMIETAQERSFRSSTKGLIKASENLYVLDKTGNGNVPVFVLFNEGEKTVYPNDRDIIFSGSNPKSGGIHIFEDGSIKLALYDGVYCSVKNRSSEDIILSKMSDSECISNIYYSQVSAPFNNLYNHSTMVFSNSSKVGENIRFNGGVWDRILNRFQWRPIAGGEYTVILDILENNFNMPAILRTDSRFDLLIPQVTINTGATGLYYAQAVAQNPLPSDSLGSIWLQTNISVQGNMLANVIILEGWINPSEGQLDRVWINNLGIPNYFTAGGWKTF